MNTTHKRKSSSRLTARGTAAVCGAAILLAGSAFAIYKNTSDNRAQLRSESSSMQDSYATVPANPYGPDDFIYAGEYLTCAAGPSMLGVDVSSHQQDVDWEQVAEAGVEFAMVRIGYRGTTSGGTYYDEYADANLRGASAAGLKVGAYFFSQAVSPQEAQEEAETCISFLKDYDLDMPVVFDWEYVSEDARTANVDTVTLIASAKAFCQTMEEAGYEPMIYFNPDLASTRLDLRQLTDYPFWLAMYTDQMNYPHQVDMWQYTANGNVPGIAGDADLNLWLRG